MAAQRHPSRRGRAQSSGQRAPSQRQLRVGEELRHALSRILARGELHDPVLSDLSLTVTEVRISPDLKNATAFVVPLGGGDSTEALDALNRASAFLRSQLGREVHLRHMPRLSFQADGSFDEAQKINALLHKPRVSRDIGQPDTGDSDPGDPDPGDPDPGDPDPGGPGVSGSRDGEEDDGR